MKLLLISIFVFFILIKPIPKLDPCNIQTAKQAIPPRIHFEQTIDGSRQRAIITRILHNKVGIFTSEVGKCYFYVFDPVLIFKSAGTMGFIFWVYGGYQIIVRKRWLFIWLLIILPIFPFFNFFTNQVPYIHKIFAIMGLIFWLRKSGEKISFN